jgi:hypothetical protein
MHMERHTHHVPFYRNKNQIQTPPSFYKLLLESSSHLKLMILTQYQHHLKLFK